MAVNASTVARDHRTGRYVSGAGSIVRHAATGIAGWWSRLATTGQLGSDRERELGRHTGARV